MSKRVLAGVAPVEFYDPSDMSYIASSNTLTDEGLQTASEEDRIAGGPANQLISKYYFNSSLKLKIIDPLFSLEYLAMKLGQQITMGSDIEYGETIITTVANQITVTNIPVAFPSTNLVVGAYKKVSDKSDSYVTVAFNGKVAQVSNLPVGSEICVKYFRTEESARSFKISSNIIPSIVYAVIKIPQFNAGTEESSFTSSSQVGTLQTIIPQFMFDPNMELAVTSSGHATTDLSGEALVNYSSDCDGGGYYAILSETTVGGKEFESVKSIIIEDSDIQLTVNDTQKMSVFAFYGGLTKAKYIDNSKLTFVSKTASTATISAQGVITAIAKGSSIIEVSVTDKPALIAKCEVVVS
ncbi:MAG: hypothetical protein RR255_00285 [Bacilli bacterium]